MGMYTQTGGGPPVQPPQGMLHQQPQQLLQGQQQPPSNQSTPSSMASPLYPWMRSQFGKSHLKSSISESKINNFNIRHIGIFYESHNILFNNKNQTYNRKYNFIKKKEFQYTQKLDSIS